VTAAIESEAAQMKGMSEVLFMPTSPNENQKPLVRDFVLKCGGLISCMPYQISSFHLCIDSQQPEDRWIWMTLVIPLIRSVVGKYCRLRTRVHCGK
jgi:hypothetical protein